MEVIRLPGTILPRDYSRTQLLAATRQGCPTISQHATTTAHWA